MTSSTKHTAGAIAQAIYERVQTILIENGFETNLGASVFQGRTRVADEQVVEAQWCLSVIEGIDVVENQAVHGRAPIVKLEQRYGLVGYAVCDVNAPNVAAHAMLRDLKKAIFGGDARFGDTVLEIKYRSRDIGPRADGVAIVMAVLEIGVVYVEDLTKP